MRKCKLIYSQKRTELSCDRGLLLWGGRVCIPASLRENVLEELHARHVGSAHMKQLLRVLVLHRLRLRKESCNLFHMSVS